VRPVDEPRRTTRMRSDKTSFGQLTGDREARGMRLSKGRGDMYDFVHADMNKTFTS
jgi:hypothetical protein